MNWGVPVNVLQTTRYRTGSCQPLLLLLLLLLLLGLPPTNTQQGRISYLFVISPHVVGASHSSPCLLSARSCSSPLLAGECHRKQTLLADLHKQSESVDISKGGISKCCCLPARQNGFAPDLEKPATLVILPILAAATPNNTTPCT
jgi:hypothetical protein